MDTQERIRQQDEDVDEVTSVFYVSPRADRVNTTKRYLKSIIDRYPSKTEFLHHRNFGKVYVTGIRKQSPVDIREYSRYCSPGDFTGYDKFNQRLTLDGCLASKCDVFDYFNTYANPLDTRGLDSITHGPVLDAERENYVLARAYEKVGQADMSLGLAVSQLDQSIGLLRHVAERLLAAWHGVRKMWQRDAPVLWDENHVVTLMNRKWRPVSKVSRRVAKEAADNWLEYSFGLVPSINDFKDATHIVDTLIKRAYLEQHGYAKDETVTKLSGITPMSEFASYKLQAEYRKTYEHRDKWTAGVYYTFRVPQPVLFKFGLDPMNLPQILWDRVPWSFVVDWFFNISSWLTRVSQRDNIVDLGNFVTHKVETKVRYDNVMMATPSTTGRTTSTLRQHRRMMWRHVNYRPIANPQLKVASFRFMRTCNATALGMQQFLRKLKR